jgi:hypothetical protein
MKFFEFDKVAFFMHGQKVVRRPRVGAFAKAVSYEWYKEIKVLARSKRLSQRQLRK